MTIKEILVNDFMIPLPKYKDQKVAVFGLGKSGLAVLDALLAGGAEVYAGDDNTEAVEHAKERFPQVKWTPYAKWPWSEIETLILSPGVPLHHPQPHLCVMMATMHGIRIIGDIELLHEACGTAQYVGITGTNGKSTTTALIGHILTHLGEPAQVGGNLGTPALTLRQQNKENERYVLEVSSYQLELLTSTSFNIAILLNITPDHLDRHGGMDGYVEAKSHIFAGQTAKDTAIISVDDDYCHGIYDKMKRGKHRYAWQGSGQKLIPISVKKELKSGIYVKKETLHDGMSGESFSLNDIDGLYGNHNMQNAAAAYAACKVMGFQPLQIVNAMRTYKGLPHRMQIIRRIGDITFINDSKATNAEAAKHALERFDNIYWIGGGVAKAEGITPLTPYFKNIRKAYLIGEAADEFATTLEGEGVNCFKTKTMQNALASAYTDALNHGNGVIMLSPACASFDQFASFEQRGTMFEKMVKGLIAPPAKATKGTQVNAHTAAT